MASKLFFCEKCEHNHRFDSKIGQRHLQYQKSVPKQVKAPKKPKKTDTKKTVISPKAVIRKVKPKKSSITKPKQIPKKIQPEQLEDQSKTTLIKPIEKKIIKKDLQKSSIKPTEKPSGNRLTRFIRGYFESYRRGVERFGIWWKVFQFSIWSIVFILLITAILVFVVYLPRIEMIYWDLQW